MKVTRVLFYIFDAVVLLAAAWYVGYSCSQKKAQNSPVTLVKTDTKEVVRTDTVTVYEPIEITHRITDTMVVFVTDTMYREVAVLLPREQKVYADSSFRAVVSGFEPRLDSLELYRKTYYQTVTNTVTRPAPRWSFGVTAGWGVQYGIINKEFDTGPAIVAGVSYRF